MHDYMTEAYLSEIMLRKLVTVVTSGKGMWETDTLFIMNPFILSELLKWPTGAINLKLTLLLNFKRWTLSIKWKKKTKTHTHKETTYHKIPLHQFWKLKTYRWTQRFVRGSASPWSGAVAERGTGHRRSFLGKSWTECAPSGNRASCKLAAPPTLWAHACSVMSDSTTPCSPSGSSARGTLQREYWSGWPFSPPGESSPPRGWIWIFCISCIDQWLLHHCATREALHVTFL